MIYRQANLENLPHQIEAIKEKERLRIQAKKDLEIWKKKDYCKPLSL